MAQLEFFSRSQLSSWRDRTASRNYSPDRDQFRREHQRHREWGLRQRHGRRAMYLRIHGDIAPPADRDTSDRAVEPLTPAPETAGSEQLPAHASRRNVCRDRELGYVHDRQADEADSAYVSPPTVTTTSAGQTAHRDQFDPADQTEPGRANRAAPLAQAGPQSWPTRPIRLCEPIRSAAATPPSEPAPAGKPGRPTARFGSASPGASGADNAKRSRPGTPTRRTSRAPGAHPRCGAAGRHRHRRRKSAARNNTTGDLARTSSGALSRGLAANPDSTPVLRRRPVARRGLGGGGPVGIVTPSGVA